ncbi:response regulator [Hymenobacter weizhouensis]|uniref:response regulator n=1 Tax=Hymenobacter sp. YIM 151500-1 TaxID=2987689 RepID=UPI002227B661|nr:response regulator transcription factor [Hymenobacter sp. YIM 151500-1]UYZ64729.1 response regulator transcription factor [Hymenobacter sp. YIM 151500-1]
MIRVVLVDDHAIIRDGVRSLLQDEADLTVVGEAGNGLELLELLAHTSADVVLMDMNMPEMNGFETTRRLQQSYPNVRVVVLSMLDHEQYVRQMREAGAAGYVLKSAGRDEIVYAIRTVAAGRQHLCPEIGLTLLDKLRALHNTSDHNPEGKPPGLLSRRETEVLKLIAEGLTTNEIADRLFTSKRTIETHRQNIIEKTQVKNTAALVKYAVTQGLIS